MNDRRTRRDDLDALVIANHAQIEALAVQHATLVESLHRDAVIATALDQRGFQVDDRAIVSVDGSKITGSVPGGVVGPIPPSSMTDGIVEAWNTADTTGGGYDASQITTGDMPAAQMQTNVQPAWNAAAGGYNAALVDTGNLPAAQMQNGLPAAWTASTGGYDAGKITTGTLPAAQLPNQGAGPADPGAATAVGADAAMTQAMYDGYRQLLTQLRSANLIS